MSTPLPNGVVDLSGPSASPSPTQVPSKMPASDATDRAAEIQVGGRRRDVGDPRAAG